MALFTAEGLSYPEAIALIKNLNDNGIESNITVGGIAVHVTPDQIPLAKEVCKEYGASFSAGYSTQQETFLLDCGKYDFVKSVTNNSLSVIKEWDEH